MSVQRNFRPATVYRPGTPTKNDYGEEISQLVADPQTIEIAISVMTGTYTVQNDIKAVRATHAARTPCRTLNEQSQIESDGKRYTVEFANNLTMPWASLYLKEVRTGAGGNNG